jgi:hypothetical protein
MAEGRRIGKVRRSLHEASAEGEEISVWRVGPGVSHLYRHDFPIPGAP